MDILGKIKGKLMDEVAVESSDSTGIKENSEEISRRAKIIRELVAEFNKNNFLRTRFREEERGKSEIEKPFNYPEHFKVTKYKLKNFAMELLEWKDSLSDRIILHLHGGGYVGPLKNTYRTMAGLYSEVGRGSKVLSIDYRVAPENPFPAALEDALAAYDWILGQGYSEDKIIFAGDSAGGGLAMALCHYLQDMNRKLPLGIVAMSPWTDLAASGESYKSNYEIDPLFGNTRDSLIFDNEYIGDNDPINPYISPMYGEFEGFPPMLIQVGTHEMLLSDSQTVAEKAKAAGVKVRYSEYVGMFHVFQMAATLMPESKKAWVEVGRFFEVL